MCEETFKQLLKILSYITLEEQPSTKFKIGKFRNAYGLPQLNSESQHITFNRQSEQTIPVPKKKKLSWRSRMQFRAYLGALRHFFIKNGWNLLLLVWQKMKFWYYYDRHLQIGVISYATRRKLLGIQLRLWTWGVFLVMNLQIWRCIYENW